MPCAWQNSAKFTRSAEAGWMPTDRLRGSRFRLATTSSIERIGLSGAQASSDASRDGRLIIQKSSAL